MLTIHTAALLWPGPGQEPVPQGAVAVDGMVIASLGPYEKVLADLPRGRVRRWPGLLTPGLVNVRAAELLEAVYHPDPLETETLGTEPIRDAAALAALEMSGSRWGESARRGLQRMLRHGTTAVTGPFSRPEVRTAVTRSGLAVMERDPAVVAGAPVSGPWLDPLSEGVPADVFAGVLTPGARADFAVFDVLADGGAPAVPGEQETPTARAVLETLAPRGAATCVATVLAGRLVHRRR